LREQVYKFAKLNPDYMFSGLKLKDWAVGLHNKYQIFTKDIIRKMQVQARDSIPNITALMLRINIKCCILDLTDSV